MPSLNILPSFSTNDRIIICEGKSDLRLIDGVLSPFTSRIFLIPAGGKSNVSKIRSLFSQFGAIYILDRDFSLSSEDALKTFKEKKVRTVWDNYDIEGYILYPDWIIEALKRMSVTPKGKRLKYYVPNDEEEVEQEIINVSKEYINEYAGRSTLQQLRYSVINLKSAIQLPDPSSKNILSSRISDWESYINDRISKLKSEAQNIDNIKELNGVKDFLDVQRKQYQVWTSNMNTIRMHFSSKTILSGLAKSWGHKYKGDTLRDELIQIAIENAKSHKKRNLLLRDNPRLKIFAYLAEKSLDDSVKI